MLHWITNIYVHTFLGVIVLLLFVFLFCFHIQHILCYSCQTECFKSVSTISLSLTILGEQIPEKKIFHHTHNGLILLRLKPSSIDPSCDIRTAAPPFHHISVCFTYNSSAADEWDSPGIRCSALKRKCHSLKKKNKKTMKTLTEQQKRTRTRNKYNYFVSISITWMSFIL